VEEEEFDVCVSSHHISWSSCPWRRGKGKLGRGVRLTSTGDEAGYVVVVEAIDALEIPGRTG
jgi:hypothetical protein